MSEKPNLCPEALSLLGSIWKIHPGVDLIFNTPSRRHHRTIKGLDELVEKKLVTWTVKLTGAFCYHGTPEGTAIGKKVSMAFLRQHRWPLTVD